MSQMKLEAKGLDLFFGAKHVLKKVSIRIPDKQVTALIGPSGCGKSTLLRCFNRMHDLNPMAKLKGDVLFEGQDIHLSKAAELRQKVGMVFQKPNPFPQSIFDNVAYGLRLSQKLTKSELEYKVKAALSQAHLIDELPDLKASAMELSGGQQQRLCIARAVAVSPSVLLMDEPCSALDPISTRKVEELVLQLKSDYCVVIVTHNMQQAKRVSDLTAFMYMGELIEFSETRQLFDKASHELTRNYLEGSFG